MTSRDANPVMQTPIELMYRAGRDAIPTRAAQVSVCTEYVRDAISTFDVQSALAGEPAIMRDALTVCGELHEALRRVTSSLSNCANVVIATADDFRRTDEQAERDFRRMDPTIKKDAPTPAVVLPQIDDPGRPGATAGSRDVGGAPLPTGHHIDPTPQPEVPTADANQEQRDDRIDGVDVPDEVTE